MQDIEAAFLSLIKEHSGIIFKISRLYRDSAEDREDLFQEIVFQLWKSYPSFKGHAGTGTWIYRVAFNTAISSFRKKKPNIRYTDTLPDVAEGGPSEEAVRRQELFFDAMKRCDDSEKTIIALYLEGLSYQQIAEIIGTSENNVGVKLNRIKSKIKKLIR